VKRAAVRLVLALLAISACVGSAGAQEIGLSYDIFDRAGYVTVWLDLAPFLGSRAVDQLKEGIDLIFECQVTLGIPRKLYGDRRIARSTHSPLIRYRPVTEDFTLEFLNDSGQGQRQFISLAGLHQFLHDSLEIPLASLDSLDSRERYVADVQVVSISLTDINIGTDRDSPQESESPVRFLFRQFLDVTSYGREESQARSRPFALSELEHLD
jgi:hypothetical protein